jgi:NADH-quinone oxidoreductase subunit G
MSKASEMITFEINGKPVTAHKNETILQVARRNGFYIPTMCYLAKVKPIASCRMCVVDIEGVNAPVLSCQERAVEGLKVQTHSETLYKHRQNIMKLYDVNHPLQCGVCPKSGECDLQNKTLEFNVEQQSFSAIEQAREFENWGNIIYDPYLCIMCERCVRVSNEIIGDEALQISPGGYNSKIINVKQDSKNVDWGECAAVCPVGALSDRDFKYNTNAWELKQIPAACVHTSMANMIYYELKRDKIYRVRSEFNFDSISGVCRYGYDYHNDKSNSKEDLKIAVSKLSSADTVRFTSMITNEEALILQKLKEKLGIKLINHEALQYKKFLDAFSSTSGKRFYSGTTESVMNSDFVVLFGSKVADDIPGLKFKVNQASKKSKAQVIYLHPMEDSSIQNIVTQFVKYEVGSEEGTLAILAKALCEASDLAEDVKAFFEDIDDGYISAESNVGEEEIDMIVSRTKKKKNFSFIAGQDLYAHPQAENIAKILGLIERYTAFNVLIIPPSVNTLGVSMICDLDEEAGENVVGYNDMGDFILSALEDAGDINMPALNQQEGTFTNIDKRVVQTHVAMPFDGFCLNDIANEFGLDRKYTIDYTKELPVASGYKAEEFDNLPNFFDTDGMEHRGYFLENSDVTVENSLEEVAEIESFDGTVLYTCNPNSQKNVFTNVCKYLETDPSIRGSKQFAIAGKIEDGDTIKVTINGFEIVKNFKLDLSLKGTIGFLRNFDLGFEGQALMQNYRFNKVKIERVDK